MLIQLDLKLPLSFAERFRHSRVNFSACEVVSYPESVGEFRAHVHAYHSAIRKHPSAGNPCGRHYPCVRLHLHQKLHPQEQQKWLCDCRNRPAEYLPSSFGWKGTYAAKLLWMNLHVEQTTRIVGEEVGGER